MIDAASADVESSLNAASAPPPPLENIAFAVNYSEPLLEQFDSPAWRPSQSSNSSPSLSSTPIVTGTDDRQTFNLENQAPHNLNSEKDVRNISSTPKDKTDTNASMIMPSKRSSKRERKRKEIARDKNRVRYDMNLVPGARRNRGFLNMHVSSGQNPSLDSCPKCQTKTTNRTEAPLQPPEPFSGNASVVWIPQKRSEWEDCISELTTVCTSAAIRRRTDKHKPFYAPLSSQYIKDRVDIDDPLHGYQVRHKAGGWLQGFILWTNFTTWTHYFKWDSLHPKSGVSNYAADPNNERIIDLDGSISKELESQPRSGDPLGGGVVFSTIAEIGLLGGLNCGEYMLKMALDDIISKKQYKFVVLQATDLSRKFYERFGFVRVGAVSRYGPKDVAGEIELVDSTGTDPDKKSKHEMASTVGYRHWTYATETTHSLDLHGGPSYMMALRLPHEGGYVCDKCNTEHLFWDEMLKIVTTDKPTIMQLGAVSTPAPKKKFRSTNTSPKPKLTPRKSEKIDTPSRKRMTKRRSNSGSFSVEKRRKIVKDDPVAKPSKAEVKTPTTRKASSAPLSSELPEQRKVLMTPPPPGKSLTYAQKQYQSVWLAVPPSSESFNPRKPPRRRNTCPEGYLTSPKAKETTPSDTKSHSKNKQKSKQRANIDVAADGEHRAGAIKKPASSKKAAVTVTSKNVTFAPQAASMARIEKARIKEKVSEPPSTGVPVAAASSTMNNKAKALRKQKVAHSPKSTPSKTYYYNKVVKAKRPKSNSPCKYHFVLNYDEESEKIRIIPLIQQGLLTGQRQGRPRFKAAVHDKSRTVSALDYKVIPAYMVTKTAIVANETWDILE